MSGANGFGRFFRRFFQPFLTKKQKNNKTGKKIKVNTLFFLAGPATIQSMGLSQNAKIMLWIGIAVYMGALLLIGFWSGRKINDLKDFLVAGRRLPLWMATAT